MTPEFKAYATDIYHRHMTYMGTLPDIRHKVSNVELSNIHNLVNAINVAYTKQDKVRLKEMLHTLERYYSSLVRKYH